MSIIQTSYQTQQNALSVQLRETLVESLVEMGAIRSSAIRQAFLSLPREAFLPFFYEEDETSRSMAWKRVGANDRDPKEYLTNVYRNESLITKTDERRWATSSSSMPSVMAKMLEALDLQPGHQVLEIGTGSGYNTALLAVITDDTQHIVTIERDAELATNARQAIEHVIGQGVTIVVADGVVGCEQRAPYDRVLATASLPTVPQAWIDQLRPGGKIVMDLQGSLTASGFLVLEKTRGKVLGQFLPEPLYFMPLLSEKLHVLQTVSKANLLQLPHGESFSLEKDHAFPSSLFDADFRWLLQWRLPGCQISTQKQRHRDSASMITSIFITEPTSQAMVRFQQQGEQDIWIGKVYGISPFWDTLQQIFAEFVALGRPKPYHYRLEGDEESTFLIIGSLRLPI